MSAARLSTGMPGHDIASEKVIQWQHNELGMARRPDASADLKAVRTGIGAELQTGLSTVLREPVPEKMDELLKRLDEAAARPSKGEDRTKRPDR